MKFDPEKYYFNDISFNLLMQKRIRKVLLICSNYDAFILEEDGRVEEQIFNEYVSLNLRYPPNFIHASSEEEAIEILTSEKIDLVIGMLGQGDTDVFELAIKLKSHTKDIHLVVLTHFSREVSLHLENHKLEAVDYVFSWLGNAELLLAIIKIIEDKINAEHDITNIGAQCILFIEDSIRYISTFLPALYKVILEHSRDFTSEALNEHQRMLRKRGRPKVLLATNLEEAQQYFDRYKNHMLGIISDVSFKRNNDKNSPKLAAGITFGEYVKSQDPNMPIIFQSSEIENDSKAKELGCNFIHKQSPQFVNELRTFLLQNFGFGEFIFRNPNTMAEVARSSDLKTLQHVVSEINQDVLRYHAKYDHFSRWLKARALFPIARLLKDVKTSDFEDIEHARNFIVNAISQFRASKSRGIIADFKQDNFDEYSVFARTGEGSIGGKARGLAFIDSVLKNSDLYQKFPQCTISIPRTLSLATSIFDDFIEENNLLCLGIESDNDQKILEYFIKAKFPDNAIEAIRLFIDTVQNPIAIRSSSKLEDAYYQSFAGVYSTYMLNLDPNEPEKSLQHTLNAIKCVYASVFFKNSKTYITATSNIIDEEKMGVLLQEVTGSWKDGYYYPTISGVARSLNFYPMEGEHINDGSASLAIGLGKYIVDGGTALHFCPSYPQNAIQLSSTGQMIKNTQKKFFGLDKNNADFKPSFETENNLVSLNLKNVASIPSNHLLLSTYDRQNEQVYDSVFMDGKRLVTFSNILKHNAFPVSEIIVELLKLGKREMSNHVEIEFAIDFTNDNLPAFNILQIRPVRTNSGVQKCPVEDFDPNEALLYSNKALGNGNYTQIQHIVYVKKSSHNPSFNKELVQEVEKINDQFQEQGEHYLLIGPGRWGSADPWLGIPVAWSQVSAAKIIAEYPMDEKPVEPSQGSHFFHNLVQFGVGYFTLTQNNKETFIDIDYLEKAVPFIDNDYIKVINTKSPMTICIDGKTGKGIVLK